MGPDTRSDIVDRGPTRRAVLAAGGASFAVAALSGCAAVLPGERRTPRPLTADETAVRTAAADALRLRDAARALAATGRAGAVPARIADEHEEHLRALAAPATGPSPEPVAADPAALRDAERQAASVALRDALTAAAGLAPLLARIAASRAVHADLVAAAGRVPPPGGELAPAAATGATSAAGTPSADEAAAVERLLRGEHVAVFAYPLVVARCAPERRTAAQAHWQAHIARRDALERLLSAAGRTPPAPEPAYDVGEPPDSAEAAAALAARVEAGLTRVAAAAVGRTTGGVREVAAGTLVEAARRAAAWGGATVALPGQDDTRASSGG